MIDVTGTINASMILYLLLPAAIGLVCVSVLALLLYDRWHALRAWRKTRHSRLTGGEARPQGGTPRQWERRPRLLPASHLAGIGAVGIGATAYLAYKGIPVLALLAAVGTGIAVWFWRSRLHDRWDRELDRQTFLLARHLRNRLEQGVTLLVALEQTHKQEYTLAAPLRDEVGLLLRRVAAGETLAEVLSTSAESDRYDGTHIYSRLLFHLGQATEEYLGPAKMAELLETFLEVATLVRDTQRTLDARIAQAKYARWIVAGLLPTVTLLIMRLAPEFGSHLLYHPAGNVALGLAALLAVLAFGIGKRLARLEPLKF